jgi:hypothetical protein
MKFTKEEIVTELMKFATVHEDYGLIITERNAERFAEDLVKNCSIPAVVGQSEQLVCPNCDGEGFSGKGTNEILPCLSCFGSGERAN